VVFPQRVIEILQRFQHPRLPTTVVDQPEAVEGLLADRGISRERRHDEREPRFAIRVLRPFELRLKNAFPAWHFADGQLHRKRNLVRLRERQALDALLPPPDSFQPRQSVTR
jgi:hypothetical protein